MGLQFEKATKAQCKARIAVFGPSGSGKTYSSLRIASGLGNKIAVIDSERGSASKYSDRFKFDKVDLDKKNIVEIVECLRLASSVYDVVIIDSLSHAWEELRIEVQNIADAKYKGNYWAAWKDGNPKQKELVDAILSFQGHIIATMRSATEWSTEKDNNGRSRPIRVGLTPEQGKGIEYEFDILLEMNVDNIGTIIKDRTGKFQGQIITKPDEKFGKDVADWLSDGDPEPLLRDEITSKLIKLTENLTKDEKTEYFKEVVIAATKDEKTKIERVSELKGDNLIKVLEIVDNNLVKSLDK